MNGMAFESITYGVLSGVISGLIVAYISYRAIEKIDIKKIHKRDVVIDGINKEFQNLNISYDKENHNALIVGLEELKNKRIYRYVLQHLNAYQSIIDNWNKSKVMIEKINENLDGLVEYILNKIKTDIDETHKEGLTYPIYHMILDAMNNDFKKLSIKTKDDGIYIDISLNKGIWARVDCNKYNRNKIKNFLKNLEKDIEFQKLTDIRSGYKNLKNEFDNNFKSGLRNLSDDIKGSEEYLKGRCEKCSFLMRFLGDC